MFKTKNLYNLTTDEVFKKIKTSLGGLSSEEAKTRLGEFGKNEIKKKQNWKWLKLCLSQFNDALVWILLVAALLAFIFGEYRDMTIILIIVFVNAIIGFFQEFKAEKILENIQKLTKDKAFVLRDGEKIEVDSRFLVPGDIVFLSSGDNVPADGYLLESYEFKVNSFVFTGESKAKRKESKVLEEEKLALPEIDNLVFMGETIATGEAKYIVTNTGMKTELGKLAQFTQEIKDETTPMQKQMRTLGKTITIISVCIGTLVLLIGQFCGMSLYENFLFAFALAVSVVPEGLPAATSVALSLGMKKLLRNNILAKKLNAVETLGSVSIICTDKTGTITKNEMTVIKVVLEDKIFGLSGEGYEPWGSFYFNGRVIDPNEVKNLELLFRIGALCNNASLVKENGNYKITGDPTEGAIIVAGKKLNKEEKFFEKGEKKIYEFPFSSDRMRMSVVYKNLHLNSYVKGSPDVMLDLCSFIKTENGIVPFTTKDKAKIKKIYNDMSKEALRVLAFAYRDLSEIEIKYKNNDFVFKKALQHESEKNLIWVGMMAMIDPPRRDVAAAIAECKKFGIKTIMITGDYEITAQAIAKIIGLVGREGEFEIINGKTLNNLRDVEIYSKVKNKEVIFARISPEQKLRIASILKNNGEIIAMTGDGVNDAPALKKADIGVAMGIMGTDVSKEASDMILLDDNFASIIQGVKRGSTIYQNLRKFVHYVFTSNAGELFTVAIGVVLQVPAPISAIQILAVDLGTDIFPSFSLGLEPEEPNVSKNATQIKKEKRAGGILGKKELLRIVYLGIIMAIGAAITFIWSMKRGGWDFGKEVLSDNLLYIKSTTAAYAVLVMSQIANLLQSRSEKLSIFKLGFFKNIYAIGSIFISLGVFLSFMYIPFFQKYLHMLPIDKFDWMLAIITAMLLFIWEEIRKKISFKTV